MKEAKPPKVKAQRKSQEIEPLPGLTFLGYLLRFISVFSPVLAARFLLFLFSLPGKRAKHYRDDDLILSAKKDWVGSPRIRTYTWGESQKRILLLHGWQSRGTALRYLVPDLLKAGFQVVALDAPAHGESDGMRMTLFNYAQAVLEVEKEKGPFVGAISHSFGGRALTFALAFLPHQWQIKRCVMLAVPASITDIFNNFFYKMKASASLIDHARQLAIKQLGRPIEETEIYNLADQLNIELLIIHDRQDNIVPLAEAERIHHVFRTSNLVITSGLGHFRLAKDPAVWKQTVDFLIDPSEVSKGLDLTMV